MSYEIVIVENGGGNTLASSTKENIDCVVLTEAIAGKSLALNKGLGVVRGELIAFIDDDIELSRSWMGELIRASAAYPRQFIFCGPVRPHFEIGPPAWAEYESASAIAFAAFSPALSEGPLPHLMTPYGCNTAVRRVAIADLRFRTDLGPSSENGALFGEDTVFFEEIRRRFGIYAEHTGVVFVPNMAVTHHITSDRSSYLAAMERYFSYGRTRAVLNRGITHLKLPPLLLLDSSAQSAVTAFYRTAEINFYFGQLYQFVASGDASAINYLSALLARANVSELPECLCPSAVPIFSTIVNVRSPH